MKRYRYGIVLAMLLIVWGLIGLDVQSAAARAGGGKSSGSRGSRTFSTPSRSYSRPEAPSRMQPPPPPNAASQPGRPASPFSQPASAGGGFFRSLAGGVVGGMLGGMLFRGLGFGGGWGGGMGGSGIGLFDILALGGIGYFIYRMVKSRGREQGTATPPPFNQGYFRDNVAPQFGQAPAYPPPQADAVDEGLSRIQQMDPSFDEKRFNDRVMDMFFTIQSAWMNRDLTAATDILTDEMRGIFQGDINQMLSDRKTNRLENIAVRHVEVNEAWQEAGQDFITLRIYANLLDYTTDDASGQVVAGSKTEPVKFEEYWTFTRPMGNNPWRLSAIQQ